MNQSSSPETAEITEPEIEAGEEHPQEWLNMRRERAYAAVTDEIRTNMERGRSAGDLLASVVRNGTHYTHLGTVERFKSLSPQELDTIRCYDVHSVYASQVAGTKITRPMFVIEDAATYRKLESTYGLTEGTSDGVALPDIVFNDLPNWRDISVVLSRNNDRAIRHEIQHSIDPNLSKRKGYDRIVGELFAYVAGDRDKNVINWAGVERGVLSSSYHGKYSGQVPEQQQYSYDEWKTKVAEALAKVKEMVDGMGELRAMRRLATVKTLDELLSLQVGELFQEPASA